MTDVSKHKYWFLLAYQVQAPGAWVPHSIIVGSDKAELNVPQLNVLKKAHQVPDAAVLIAVSPLGWQTEKSINGLPEIDPPTKPSQAYRLGMVAASRVRISDEQQPINPFTGTKPEEVARADEWAAGFQAVREAQSDAVSPVPCAEPLAAPTHAKVGERAEPAGSSKGSRNPQK